MLEVNEDKDTEFSRLVENIQELKRNQ